MDNVLDAYFQIPIVTRCYLTLQLVVSAALTYGMLAQLDLFYFYDDVFYEGELWRLITSFLLPIPLGFPLLVNMYFFHLITSKIEQHYYFNNTKGFLAMITMLCAVIFFILPKGTYFFFFSYMEAIYYIWSRRYPYERLLILNLFVVPAPYAPLFNLILRYFLYGSWDAVRDDIYGLFAGHIIWYASDVLPLIAFKR